MLLPVILAVAYVLGSIPFAYLIVRRLHGVDLREIGSGNLGAANALRTAGAATGTATMMLDATKGIAAVVLAQRVTSNDGVAAAAGVAAVVGHIFPVWLGFRGGKGVATACGAFSILAPAATMVVAGMFAITVWLTGYVSLGSLVGSLAIAPITYAMGGAPAVVFAAAISATIIIARHRPNLLRLLTGTERRVGEKA